MIATKPFTAIKSIPPERSTTTLKKQLDIAYEDRPARSIALEKYNEIAQRKEARMTKLDELVSRLTAEDKSFIVDAPYLLELASKAVRLSESSRSGLRNKMLKILFSNLKINQKRVDFALLEPFNSLFFATKTSNWLPPLDDFANAVASYDRSKFLIIKETFLELGIEVKGVDEYTYK